VIAVSAAVLATIGVTGVAYARMDGHGSSAGGGHDMSGMDMSMPAADGSDAMVGPQAGPAHDMAGMSGHDVALTATEGPGGTSMSRDGYRLQMSSPLQVRPGDTIPLRFSVMAGASAVTSFADENSKKMHLIVIRRDLTGFQHLHPTMDAAGTWSVPLRLGAPGSYRAFADFLPADRAAAGGMPLSLGVDLAAPGDWQPTVLPPAAAVSTSNGLSARLSGTAVAGEASDLTFTLNDSRGPVQDLQPYLGSYGHLVALREGDLAYLHVHPIVASAGSPMLTFGADFPTPGRYRLFLQVQRGGKVTPLPFTLVVPAG
jgi:hypothetical protein